VKPSNFGINSLLGGKGNGGKRQRQRHKSPPHLASSPLKGEANKERLSLRVMKVVLRSI